MWEKCGFIFKRKFVYGQTVAIVPYLHQNKFGVKLRGLEFGWLRVNPEMDILKPNNRILRRKTKQKIKNKKRLKGN